MNEDIQAPNTQQTTPPNPVIGGNPLSQPFGSQPASIGSQPPLTPASAPKKRRSMSVLFVVLAFVLAAAAGWFAYGYGKTKAPTKVVTKTVAPPEFTVPQGATVISQCVPGKGALYALPKDIPTGPTYLVNKGKVIGAEFMVGKDDLLKAGKNFLNLPLSGLQYDHINIGLLSQGHAGFPSPHYHVDVFMIPDSEASAITCPAA